jgi:hypothetical protein
MRKIVSVFMVLCLSFGLLGSMASAAGVTKVSKEKMEKMVEQRFEDSIKAATGDKKKQLSSDYEKYKGFSKTDKDKFISYMSDPELTNTIMESLTTMEPGDVKTFEDGDIDLSVDYEEANEAESNVEVSTPGDVIQPMATSYRKAWYKRTVSFLGLNILEVYAFVNYTHNGSRVTSTYGCDAYTSRNLNPTLDYEWGRCIRSYNSYQAWATASVRWSIIYSGLGMVFQHHEVRVWGNYKNQAGGSVTKL